MTQDFLNRQEVSIGPFNLNPRQMTECPPIINFSNGFLDCTNGFVPDSVCDFICDQGFYLSGLSPSKNSIKCVSLTDSKWDHAIPTCEDVDECSVNGIDPCSSSGKYANKVCKNIPGSYICECRKGFESLPGSPNECLKGSSLEGTMKFDEAFPSLLGDPHSNITVQITSALTESVNSFFANTLPGYQILFRITKFSPGSIMVYYDIFLFHASTGTAQDFLDIKALEMKMRREWKTIHVSDLHLVPVENNFELVDRNECLNPDNHDCSDAAKCINTPGSFSCECGVLFEDAGDLEFPGRKCEPVQKWKIVAYILSACLLIGLSFIVIKKKYNQTHLKVEPEPGKYIRPASAVLHPALAALRPASAALRPASAVIPEIAAEHVSNQSINHNKK